MNGRYSVVVGSAGKTKSFDCSYDIHELVTEEYLPKIFWGLNEEHKELLVLPALLDKAAKQQPMPYWRRIIWKITV